MFIHTHTYFDNRPLGSNCRLSKYTISSYFRDTEIHSPLPTDFFVNMESTYMWSDAHSRMPICQHIHISVFNFFRNLDLSHFLTLGIFSTFVSSYFHHQGAPEHVWTVCSGMQSCKAIRITSLRRKIGRSDGVFCGMWRRVRNCRCFGGIPYFYFPGRFKTLNIQNLKFEIYSENQLRTTLISEHFTVL